jgi:Na+-driven multidrug efflux pump
MTQTHDLTTGSLAGHFLRLAVPAAIGMVFSTLYNVVDVFFAGLISKTNRYCFHFSSFWRSG